MIHKHLGAPPFEASGPSLPPYLGTHVRVRPLPLHCCLPYSTVYSSSSVAHCFCCHPALLLPPPTGLYLPSAPACACLCLIRPPHCPPDVLLYCSLPALPAHMTYDMTHTHPAHLVSYSRHRTHSLSQNLPTPRGACGAGRLKPFLLRKRPFFCTVLLSFFRIALQSYVLCAYSAAGGATCLPPAALEQLCSKV